jgi:hypothetical protein
MACPKCGNTRGTLLFTSYRCVSRLCENFDPEALQARIAESFSTKGTTTGRLSSKKPNFSNIPKGKVLSRPSWLGKTAPQKKNWRGFWKNFKNKNAQRYPKNIFKPTKKS